MTFNMSHEKIQCFLWPSLDLVIYFSWPPLMSASQVYGVYNQEPRLLCQQASGSKKFKQNKTSSLYVYKQHIIKHDAPVEILEFKIEKIATKLLTK